MSLGKRSGLSRKPGTACYADEGMFAYFFELFDVSSRTNRKPGVATRSGGCHRNRALFEIAQHLVARTLQIQPVNMARTLIANSLVRPAIKAAVQVGSRVAAQLGRRGSRS